MITGKENLLRAMNFKGPSHLPVHIDLNFDWLVEKDEVKQREIIGLMDGIQKDMIVRGYHSPDTPEEAPEGIKKWRDIWDVGWEDNGHGARVISHPLEAGYESLARYSFPESGNPAWFANADSQFASTPGLFHVGTVWFTLFERLWMLRGFNNMLMDPYIYESEFMALRDRIVDFCLVQIDSWPSYGADAVYFSDDWGSQRALLMNPDDWRVLYKPAYKKLFDRVHEKGLKVFMHLCGNVTSILPDLIDIGLNVLNPVQPQAMDVELLSREFGGDLCFYGGIDVQGTMVHGSSEEIRKEISRLVELFGRFNGGYICSTSHSLMPETPLDNIITMLRTIQEFQ